MPGAMPRVARLLLVCCSCVGGAVALQPHRTAGSTALPVPVRWVASRRLAVDPLASSAADAAAADVTRDASSPPPVAALSTPRALASRPLSRDAWLALVVRGAATAAVTMPTAAQASFGPAGGAVTSSPPAKVLTLDQYEALSDEKFDQVGGALGTKVLEELLQQSDQKLKELLQLIDQLNPREPEPEVAPENTAMQSQKAATREDTAEKVQGLKEELAKQQQLQDELRYRQKLLAKLDAQPSWFTFMAAFAASMASTLVMHPVDTIKTRRISQQGKSGPPAEFEGEGEGGGVGSLLADLPSLYTGIVGNLFKEGPSSALYLGVYETVKTMLLHTPIGAQPLGVYLLAGAAGELCGTVIRVPAETVKASVQSGRDASTGDSVARVLGTAEGRENVVRAWTSSLYRDLPMGAIQIALFEGLKVFIINDPSINFNVNTLWAEALLGAFGGGVAALVTAPPDVITTRIITRGDEEEPVGVFEMAREVWDEGGVGAVFTGWRQRALYWAPAIGLFLSCYCYIRRFAVTHDFFQ